MRLRTRNRQLRRRPLAQRISISQEEITADLLYPARRPSSEAGPPRERR